jgi:hypothetical protein
MPPTLDGQPANPVGQAGVPVNARQQHRNDRYSRCRKRYRQTLGFEADLLLALVSSPLPPPSPPEFGRNADRRPALPLERGVDVDQPVDGWPRPVERLPDDEAAIAGSAGAGVDQ